MKTTDLDRLRHLWRLGPPSASLLCDLVSALVRAGRADEAWATAYDAARAGALPSPVIAAAIQPYALDRWHSLHGQAPFRAALCAAPRQAPEIVWRWRSHDPHDTFGKPMCAGFGCVAVIAQNTVVGMRFERLVCLDAATGHMRWSQERRALLASAAPAWAGGDRHPPSLLWAYITPATPTRDDADREGAPDDEDEDHEGDDEGDDDARALLCIERFDLATGRLLSRAQRVLPTSAGLEADPCLIDWGKDKLAWLLRWRTGDCALALIDRDSGDALGIELLPISARAALRVGDDTFALDDTGLVQLQGARVTSLAISSTSPAYALAFSTPQALCVSSAGHMSAFTGPVHGGRWSLSTRRFSPFSAPSAPSGDLYPIAASPGGVILCAIASPGASPLVVALPPDPAAQPAALPVAADLRTLYRRGLWMGGCWLVCASHPAETSLCCVEALSRACLWTQTYPGPWLQGPIPVSSHAIAAIDSDGVILLADMSDSPR